MHVGLRYARVVGYVHQRIRGDMAAIVEVSDRRKSGGIREAASCDESRQLRNQRLCGGRRTFLRAVDEVYEHITGHAFHFCVRGHEG